MSKKALGIEGKRNEYGTGIWIIYSDGSRSPLPHVVRHSPTGMEWGYGGSGPADLALSMLSYVMPSCPDVEHWYMDFKFFHVAQFSREGFFMLLERIRDWCDEQRAKSQ